MTKTVKYGVLFLPALVLGLFFMAGNPAQAAPSDVKIENAYSLGSFGPSTCPGVQAVIFNNSFSMQSVLINFELRDGAGNLVSQVFYDNYGVNSGSQTVSAPCNKATLKDGTYYYSVGIFAPAWGYVVDWLNLPSFSVGECLDRPCGTNPPPASEPSPAGDVILNGNLGVQPSPSQCKAGSFAIKNTGNSPVNVLVDIELYNGSGQQLTQKFYDNVAIGGGQSLVFDGDCSNTLPAGSYRYSVGIFKTGWAGIIHWYDAADTFTKTDGSVPPGTFSPHIISATVDKSQIPAGQTATFTAEVANSPASAAWLGIVDLELFDSNGQKVAQMFYNASIAAGSSQSFTLTTLPGLPAGTYTLKVGLFNSSWSSLYQWLDSGAGLIVL